MIWKDIKDFISSLDENQLNKKVVLWRESESIEDLGIECLKDDHYYDPNQPEDGCFSKKDAIDMSGNLDNYEKCFDKGQPIIWENF